MTFVLGLTGSIGMGKTTTAALFADEGVPVWDADAAVHQLYAPGQPAALALADLFPAAIAVGGGVDRPRLREILLANPSAMDRLNAAVHPLVADDRAQFLAGHSGADIVVLDVPLLFETGLAEACDAVAVVSAPPDVQRERVLARGMTEADLALILSRQMPDAEKRARADHVILTTDLESARRTVRELISNIRKGIKRHA